ncbi:MAG: acetyl-CoA carboxylase biotin carboxylase subunit [Dehalococcoidia bacterium]|nr:acetyl-CoA carboxylase biotin carboxylase subunit [Dehalococcoidia bacterium]
MFDKILIANRGEIAVRVIRACHELGVRTVVAYSEADRDSLAVRLADEAVCVGPPAAAKSYLNIPNIVSAALVTGCDAIHPGYGFLSENAYFAEICEKCSLVFIGPPPGVMEEMGDKAAARKAMRRAGLPLVPGTETSLKSVGEAREAAELIGYPVVLKATMGGGGRGMRVAQGDAELARFYPIARAEAEGAFGSGELYLEKYMVEPRHIEFQFLADQYGKTVHFGERDCSLQRHHQKVLEESPSVVLSPEMRASMGEMVVKAMRSIGYVGAGTVELLLDRNKHFYFIETNARIQVEHPVTEMVTGVDLVKWQIRIAAGEHLTLDQEGIIIRGHAIECRINAEDHERAFRPDSGRIESYLPPGGPGVRVDSHLFGGCFVPPYYDSLLAKLIVWGQDRDDAIRRMDRALSEFVIEGVKTTIPLQRQLVNHPSFRKGDFHTRFIERHVVPSDNVAVPEVEIAR